MDDVLEKKAKDYCCCRLSLMEYGIEYAVPEILQTLKDIVLPEYFEKLENNFY